MTAATLAAAREAICAIFGVLPGLMNPATTGPMVREAQRHLAQWTLQPIAALIADEASQKFGAPVTLDTLRPLQAFFQTIVWLVLEACTAQTGAQNT